MRLFGIILSLILKQIVDGDNGGWITDKNRIIAINGPCNIEHHDARTLSQDEFELRFAYYEPVILTNVDNSEFRSLCSKEQLLNDWGKEKVHLNSANTYSYGRVPSTLALYINKYLQPQNIDKLGNETFYLFGDIDQAVWKPLLDKYKKPRFEIDHHKPALSFGIAGAGTGVPFHFHGPGFAEVIYGRKRWFLYPYEKRPNFDPNKTTLTWYTVEYPKLARAHRPLECLLNPGEVIYFPNKWWHATLNCETAIFVSTFLSP